MSGDGVDAILSEKHAIYTDFIGFITDIFYFIFLIAFCHRRVSVSECAESIRGVGGCELT